MMFECSIIVLPSPVSALYQYISIIYPHNTRKSKFIHTLIGRSEATYRTFSYRGDPLWCGVRIAPLPFPRCVVRGD